MAGSARGGGTFGRRMRRLSPTRANNRPARSVKKNRGADRSADHECVRKPETVAKARDAAVDFTPPGPDANFTLRTQMLVEVLYTRVHCNRFLDLMLSCTRFTADFRYPEFSYSFVNTDSTENESVSDNEPHFYNNEDFCVKDSNMINQKLIDLGFACKIDKMYTVTPSQFNIYQQNKTEIISNNICPSKKNSSANHSPNIEFENLSLNTTKSYSLKSSPEKNNFIKNDVDSSKNYSSERSVTPQNSEYIYTKKQWSPLNFNKKKSPYKYWLKRHMLFSKFDLGILLDEESLYSVCPEILSYHIAQRCKNDIALDPFCGAGGNIIQLAFTCKLVLAIDIDPNKIKLARHNAEIYGVADKIEFIVGDFFTITSMLKADVIYMSPPWGGPEYLDADSFSIESICKKKYYGGFGIFDIVKKIAPSIAFHMPKTTNIYECLWLANDFGKVEIQQNIINGIFNSITAFYGEFTNITYDDY